jgi:hypothetical protein
MSLRNWDRFTLTLTLTLCQRKKAAVLDQAISPDGDLSQLDGDIEAVAHAFRAGQA